MREKGRSRLKRLLFLGAAGSGLLFAQARLSLSHGPRAILLMLWVLLVYGSLGLFGAGQSDVREDNEEANRRSAALRPIIRIESPVEKVQGEIRPRFVVPAEDVGTEDDDMDSEVR